MEPGVGPTRVKSGKIPLSERVKISHKGAIGEATSDSNPKPKRAKPSAAASPAAAAAAGRAWTTSVAIPAAMLEHAQTQELRSQLVGQVARACAIFNVDEIVIYSSAEDRPPPAAASRDKPPPNMAVFMARLLQYIDCPSYLRKHVFPHHPDLRCVGLIAPLDAQHHLRLGEECEYREAVVVATGQDAADGAHGGDGSGGGGGGGGCDGAGELSCSVHTGLRKEMKIKKELPVGTRVTLRMPAPGANKRLASVVAPRAPREVAGYYWGYNVRVAQSLAAVWSECPHASGYDLSVGASEQGAPLHAAGGGGPAPLPKFAHLLVVFEGAEGLGPAVAADDELDEFADDVGSLFDRHVDLCPARGARGCRSIRTEEALLVGLGALRPLIDAAQR
jgi:hypothetical protein